MKLLPLVFLCILFPSVLLNWSLFTNIFKNGIQFLNQGRQFLSASKGILKPVTSLGTKFLSTSKGILKPVTSLGTKFLSASKESLKPVTSLRKVFVKVNRNYRINSVGKTRQIDTTKLR